MRQKDMSKLRINRGTLRGRFIYFVETPDLRPTLGRVREAVFNMVDDFHTTHGFLDLCAGTGIMAFEAVSNGFDPVHAVEIDTDAVAAIVRNRETLSAPMQVHRAYAEKVNKVGLPQGPWVIFADPPYRERRFHVKVLERLADMPEIEAGSIFVAEQDQPWQHDIPAGWSLWKEKRYGRIHLFLFQRE